MDSSTELLIKIIKENSIHRFAEVGVFDGKNAETILENCSDILKEYWGVDKYSTTFRNGKKYWRHLDEKAWYGMYKDVCRHAVRFPQFQILKMDSGEAAALFPKRYFPDGYFDFVYIDADHYYEAVMRDIELWLPLVKKGGIVGGHDYGVRKFAEVEKAVKACFPSDRIQVYKKQTVWIVDKPNG